MNICFKQKSKRRWDKKSEKKAMGSKRSGINVKNYRSHYCDNYQICRLHKDYYHVGGEKKESGKMHTYKELLKDAQQTHTAKEYRKLHKELKNYGDGIPFRKRYPALPGIILVIAAVGVLGKIIVLYMLQ